LDAGDSGSAGIQELGNTVASIFAVAVGVLCGTLLLSWATATGRAIGGLSDSAGDRAPWFQRPQVGPTRWRGPRRDGGERRRRMP
jgi:hypothetical protein